MVKISKYLQIKITALNKTEHRVSFDYSALNASGRDLYIFNLLPSADRNKVSIDPKRVYVQVDGSTLAVSKRLIEVPEDVDVLAPEVPFLSELPSGKSFQETITLELPVREDYPYAMRRTASQPEQRRTCTSLVFLLGFLMPPDRQWVRRAKIDGREVFATDYGFAIQMNLVASSEPVAVTTECLLA